MKQKILIITAVLILMIAGGVYGGVAWYFHSHFFPNSSIGDLNISGKTIQETEEMLENALNQYQLTILESDQESEQITAEEAGLSYTDFSRVEKSLQDQNIWRWPLVFFHNENQSGEALSVSFDEEKLNSRIQTLSCMNPDPVKKSTSASISYDESKEAYVINPETIGNELQEELFTEAVKDAIVNLDEQIDLTDNSYYKQPEYTSESEVLVSAYQQLNEYLSTSVSYSSRGLTAELTNKDISGFLKISDKFKVSIDRTKINEYVNNTLFPIFNTVGAKRTFTSKGSGKITISGGNYGWRVGVVAETDAIEQNLKDHAAVTREPEYLIEGAGDSADDDIGDTYVDISISSQHLWYVENGKVVLECDVVTGDTSKGRDTPTGVWMVEDKKRNYKMSENPVKVSYWLPFDTTRGIGMHDASWRSSFGKSIYKSNGSHGCVNMPPSKMKTLYEQIKVNTPVIVH